MVEGPGVHRVAVAHRRILQGRVYQANSPNGRFADGAAAINGHVLSHIEAHGKHIFYFFTPKKLEEEGLLEKLGPDAVVVHIHFGMAGTFHTFPYPGPEPRPTTRLRLENKEEGFVAHLSASLISIAELGPDPLRQDADKEVVWSSMQKTKRAIGAFLMDQSRIAGIGNIYRSELLLVAGIHPDHPACSVSHSSFESLWIQAKRLFEIGVQTGYIITILTDDAGNPLPTVRGGIQSGSFVYNQKECGVCGGIVFRWKINQRAVFACQACQPPPPTVAVRKVACIPSTRLGGRDYTLEIEDLAVLENLNTAVKTSKKTVAKGGQVVEHQAFKHINTGGLPEAFEISGLSAGAEDTKDSQDHALAEVTVQISTVAITPKFHQTPSKLQTKHRAEASNGQDEEEETLESNLLMSEVPVERQKGERSSQLRKKVDPATLYASCLGGRGISSETFRVLLFINYTIDALSSAAASSSNVCSTFSKTSNGFLHSFFQGCSAGFQVKGQLTFSHLLLQSTVAIVCRCRWHHCVCHISPFH
ncbi:unnamed protein product [Sphagnum jensenii]|uniref:DNA-(apurinic or apyrimidinic site) lyase n=1 Tax=Sphagnum jensenii TaxID=128206 RepID=A0ABP1AY35_9BRYO